jgi:hypothetical protein
MVRFTYSFWAEFFVDHCKMGGSGISSMHAANRPAHVWSSFWCLCSFCDVVEFSHFACCSYFVFFLSILSSPVWGFFRCGEFNALIAASSAVSKQIKAASDFLVNTMEIYWYEEVFERISRAVTADLRVLKFRGEEESCYLTVSIFLREERTFCYDSIRFVIC